MQINVEKLRYIPIETDKELMKPYLNHAFCRMVFDLYAEFYPKVGYQPPWIGYFVLYGDDVVGVGGYKGGPVNGRVEIAYGTVPEFEGQGISSRTCKFLTTLALETHADLQVTARTLMEENASTSILRKNGYKWVGTIVDPEDGEVWEWIFVGP